MTVLRQANKILTGPSLPLLKGGEATLLNNYRPISKLSVLAKVLESLVSEQVKVFFMYNESGE